MDHGAISYRRFLDGDSDGIVEIIRDYKDGLMLYLNGYVKNIHVAEELMEDTFVQLVVKRPRFSEKSSFKTWLYSIGRNITVDYIRKAAKHKVISADVSPLALQEEEELVHIYLREERKQILHRALARLHPEYCRVLHLLFFEDFDIADIARILKKSKKQVENLVYRAKQSLKTSLEKEGFLYEDL